MMSAGAAPPPTSASAKDHAARVIAALARAAREIPYYVGKGRTAPEAGATLGDALAAQPLLFKADVRTVLPRLWAPQGTDVRGALASGELELVETGGTAEERVRVLWARGAWHAWRTRALAMRPASRALAAAAASASASERPSEALHEATLMAPERGGPTCHSRDLSFEERLLGARLWLHTRGNPTFWSDAELDRMIAEIARHETVGLEADPAYLAPVARRARATGKELGVSSFVTLGHGLTTPSEARAIAEATRAPRFGIYGATETGPLFVEGEDGSFRHVEGPTHVELLPVKVPTPGARDVALVVVTTIDGAHPFVRYVLGDLVAIDPDAAPSADGTPALRSIEGRVADALVLPGGALVTAGAFIRAVGAIDGVRAAQAHQKDAGRVEIDVVLEDGASEGALDALREAAATLLTGAEVAIRRVTAVAPEPNGRYRSVRRSTATDWAATFHGCEGVQPPAGAGT